MHPGAAADLRNVRIPFGPGRAYCPFECARGAERVADALTTGVWVVCLRPHSFDREVYPRQFARCLLCALGTAVIVRVALLSGICPDGMLISDQSRALSCLV